jgi:hypothetical protein
MFSDEKCDARRNVILILIQLGMEYNFQKFSWDDTQNLSSPYDTGSIMHYGAYAFSKDRKMPTILPKNPNHKIGQRTNFSTV